jgi:8-oxo-dGTP pyrophosphatase MutT (NUDIX family)
MAEDLGGAAAPTGGGGAKRRRRRRRPAKARAAKADAAKAGSGTPKTDPETASTSKSTRRRRTATRSTSKADAAKGSQRSKRKRKRRPGRRAEQAGSTKREVSAGGVVYRREDDGIEVVLASRRTRRGDLAWGLAKGGIEDGESMEDAAVREVREETGIRAEIETSLGETRYFYVWEDVRIRKTVHFFLMRSVGGDPDDRDDEMEEVRWFPLERALKRAAYRGERDVLQRAAELLR